MTTNRFDVCVDWAGETLQVGTLYAHDRSAAVGFEYASAWLARADAFAIDPTALPLRQGAFHALDLPGALADAGPDRWGRIVIERSVRQGVLERRPYRAIDYLLAIEDTARIGAIRLRPSGGTDFLGATRGVIPPLIRLRELLAATEIEEAVAGADRFGLRLAAARAIVGDVQAAIGRWRSIAVRAGIADAALGAFADCFRAP